MIEVMMALALLAVGASGVVAMQKATVVGNASAKSISTGTALATRWAERLRLDAMVWNTLVPLNDIGETRWLKTVIASPNVWNLPPSTPLTVSPDADPIGADIVAANDEAVTAYCTHIAFRQITPKMVSAVVRVTWRRDNSIMDCSGADMFIPETDLGRYGAVYVTTGLMTQEHP
jgi:type IV pilus assembly protein PilV